MMPPPLSDHKDMICSCPPFECFCRSVTNHHADNFLGQSPLLQPFAQPPLLSPTALSFGHPTSNPYESFDHMGIQQPMMRDTYSEYFDLSPIERFHPQGFSSFEAGAVKSEPIVVPNADIYTKTKPSFSIQDCMYSSNTCTVSPNQQAEPVLPTYSQSHHDASRSSNPPTPPNSNAGVVPGSPYQNTVTPSSSYNSPPHYSLSGTTPQSHHQQHQQHQLNNDSLVNSSPNVHELSPQTLDQFEFNDAADFLSLDQPINKELPAPACANNRKPTVSSSDVTKGATSDLSALLGLPSISSFLDEGEGENPANEHIDKILGLSLNYGERSPESHKSNTDSLSPASSSDQKVPSERSPLSPCRGPTPPSLIELQPLKSNNENIASPKKFSDIFQTAKQTPDLHQLNQQHFAKASFHAAYSEHSAHRYTTCYTPKQQQQQHQQQHYEEQTNVTWHSDVLFALSHHGQQHKQQHLQPLQQHHHQQQLQANTFSNHNHSINITLSYN